MTVKKGAKNSLEHSLKRLEDIVETLERGETSLDDAVILYEEGVQISKECAERLKAVELRIQKLSKDIDGQFSLHEPDDV
ncbi:MAG: exodeoxyribonuclease VII small subunit [Ignavibacteriae bacterium]|nr:MAG: exodeoxyribonuclease VII small subunit [Ignavibacteriota bacterium]